MDGRQRLSSEAHRADCFQVLQRADFAGGVALQGHWQFISRYALAVVFYRDQPDAASQQPHSNLPGACV